MVTFVAAEDCGFLTLVCQDSSETQGLQARGRVGESPGSSFLGSGSPPPPRFFSWVSLPPKKRRNRWVIPLGCPFKTRKAEGALRKKNEEKGGFSSGFPFKTTKAKGALRKKHPCLAPVPLKGLKNHFLLQLTS